MQDDIQLLIVLTSQHLSRRPAMQARDLYKLLYQSVRGPEHIISSAQAFRDRLQEEWEGLDTPHSDPLYESIRPDGRLVRLNLRPYKAAGGHLPSLIAACLETGELTWGTQADLVSTWGAFLAACEKDQQTGLARQDLQALTLWLTDKGYPALHHSDTYRQLYRPAYRLVAAGTDLYHALGSLLP